MDDQVVREQVDAALAVLRRALAPAEIIGAYLYDSAVVGGLRPDSDRDPLVVTNRSLQAAEKVTRALRAP